MFLKFFKFQTPLKFIISKMFLKSKILEAFETLFRTCREKSFDFSRSFICNMDQIMDNYGRFK